MITRQLIAAHEQISIAHEMKKNHAVLLTEWVYQDHDETVWFTIYLSQKAGLHFIQSLLEKNNPILFDLSEIFPVCNRLQRTIAELFNIPTLNSKDNREWLTHNKPYSFQSLSTNDAHEIPVGPVHAGIIEPGHFRFSVIGEEILKLETRFGYAHKGIHALLKNKSIEDAQKIIGRVSGDSTVAYANAFAIACEDAVGFALSEKIKIERAILLERERIANHIGDIGAIINDTGMPTMQSFFQILKEKILRANKKYYCHRYAMDIIKPFEKNNILSAENYHAMMTEYNQLNQALYELKIMVDSHHGLQDRLQTTGIVTHDQAIQLGLLGLTAKASGIDNDVRRIFSDRLYNNKITACDNKTGDVAARISVRFKESFESLQLIQSWIPLLSENHADVISESKKIGIGCVEGWRGPITVILSIKNNVITWCHCHDPSWQNWLAIEHAVMENIVADFPLINKSFNLSYSGSDC